MDVYLCKLGCAFEPAPGFYLTSSMGKKGFFGFMLALACMFMPQEVFCQDNSDSLYNTALSEAMKNVAADNYPSSIMYLKECIKLKPGKPAPYYELSRVYGKLADGTQAVYYAKKAFALDENNLWYEEYLLSTAARHEKYDAVQMVLERRFARGEDVISGLLDAYSVTGDWDKSLSAVAAYEKKHGRSETSAVYRKDIYLKKKDFKNALAQLKILQKMSPDNSQYAIQRAMVLNASGHSDASWKYLEEFYSKHPSDGMVAYTLLSRYNELNDYDNMFSAIQVVAADTSIVVQDRIKILDMTAPIAAANAQYYPVFEKSLLKVLESADKVPFAYAYAGDYYFSRGENKKGMEMLRKAIHKGFDDENAALKLLYAQAQEGYFKSLYDDARLVLQQNGENAQVYYLYSFAAHALGDLTTAISAMEQAKSLAKDGSMAFYVEVCAILGSYYHDAGNHDASDANFRLALKIDPENPGVLNNYAYFLALRGKELPEARRMIEKALSHEPEQPSFLDTYAWILYLQKDYAKARTTIERVLSIQADQSSEVLGHYRDILKACGDDEGARKADKMYLEKKAAERETDKKDE